MSGCSLNGLVHVGMDGWMDGLDGRGDWGTWVVCRFIVFGKALIL